MHRFYPLIPALLICLLSLLGYLFNGSSVEGLFWLLALSISVFGFLIYTYYVCFQASAFKKSHFCVWFKYLIPCSESIFRAAIACNIVATFFLLIAGWWELVTTSLMWLAWQYFMMKDTEQKTV